MGTKRHEDLSSGFDTDGIRFETTLQIPVHERGSIISYRRDDFSADGLSVQTDLDNPASGVLGSNDSRHYLHEIGYAHSLSDQFDINLSAIHENFGVYTAWSELSPDTSEAGYPAYDSAYDTADRLGFKLAGAFQPSPWLSITPSIIYYDYAKGNEDILNAPDRKSVV